MAADLAQYLNELSAVYKPQEDIINNQVAGLGAQQAEDQAGLDATKNREFAGITNRANARNMTYSGVAPDEEATYLGANYLPAVAGLKRTYAEKKSGFGSMLAELSANKYNTAYSRRQTDLAAEEEKRRYEQNRQDALAAARYTASASGGGGGGGGGYSGGGGAPAPAPAPAQAQSVDMNGYINMIRGIRQQQQGVKDGGSYGAVAAIMKRNGINLNRGGQADLALRKYYGFG